MEGDLLSRAVAIVSECMGGMPFAMRGMDEALNVDVELMPVFEYETKHHLPSRNPRHSFEFRVEIVSPV